jgi:hypothetical protein
MEIGLFEAHQIPYCKTEEKRAETKMTKCAFTYEHYAETLRKAQRTYTFYTFGDFPKSPQKRFIILRHDVDAHVSKALEMAKIDNELAIPATFFIRLHGPYNPFRQPSYEAILEIAKLGHQIGLHYEPVFYLKYGFPVEETLLFEIELLSRMLKTKIKSIAPHMPSLAKMELGSIREKFNDPYLPKFFKEIKYISDSNKRWREGCMCKWIEKSEQIQIAVHPHWWNGDSVEGYLDKYKVL